MNSQELSAALDALNIPKDMYSIMQGGFPNEAFCLVSVGDTWEVYYSERGKKKVSKKFASETEACEYLLAKLDKYARK